MRWPWRREARRARRHCVPLPILLLAAAAASAQPYPGPPDPDAFYWEAPAYARYPLRGPQKARGLLLWNHGVAGKTAQWQYPPARFIDDFARDGWDVLKVNRNNMMENGWDISGPDHVANVLRLGRKARTDGYRRVIVAGQSYGGAIALEAGAAPGLFDGVIATAPGHGSDSCGANMGLGGRFYLLPDMLELAILRLKAPRVVVAIADGDTCLGGFTDPTEQIRGALRRSGTRFVFLDESMPVRGHHAVYTRQFQRWYGKCLRAFLDFGDAPGPGETTCPSPDPAPRFFMPKGYRKPRPTGAADLRGEWSGFYDVLRDGGAYDRDVCIVIRDAGKARLDGLVAFGAGPARIFSMNTVKRSFGREGARFIYRGKGSYEIVLNPTDDRDRIDLSITSVSGNTTWEASLRRGC